MIYSIFLKKNEKDLKPFPIVRIVRNFLWMASEDVFILGWPGYIGRTSSSIDDFKKEITTTKGVLNGYFFKALNGNRIISHPTTGVPINTNDYQNEIFGNYCCPSSNLEDHSKILVFVKFTKEVIDKNLYDVLSNKNFEVLALLIGSSNQSFNTYGKSPTPKGEADVFMFDSEFLQNSTDENQTICKLLYGEDNNPIEDYSGSTKKEKENIIISKQLKLDIKQTTLKEIVLDLLNKTI